MNVLTLFIFSILSLSSIAGVLTDVPSALKFHFGDYEVKREQIFLTSTTIKELERISKAKFESRI